MYYSYPRNILVLALVIGLAAAPSFAKTEGSLSGQVKDGSGEPLPGVTVMVESPELLGGSRTTTSDAKGSYRFPALPPGTYKVSAELFGFKKFEQDGLQIQINQPATFDPILTVEGVEIGIEVRAHEDIVQPEKTQVSTALNNEFVDNIPVLGRAYQSLLALAPGVTFGDSFFGGNPTSHGARSDANQYLFDGGNTGDTALGTFGQNFNQDAVDQIEVITAGYKAEFGRSDGAIANVLTKSGGNNFEGSFRFDIRDSSLDTHGSGKAAIKDQDFYRRYYSATLGGPIIKDRFWFFASYYFQDREEIVQYSGSALYPVQERPADIYDYFAKLTYQISDDHQLLFSFHHDPATFHNAYRSGDYPPHYRNQQYQQSEVYLVKETAIFSPNVFLESLVNIMDDNNLEVGPDENAPASGHSFNGFDRVTRQYFGRDPDQTLTTRDRSQIREDLSVYIDDAKGTHDMKFGISYELESTFQDETDEDFYILEDGVFVEKQFTPNDPNFPSTESAHTRILSVYAQDSWSPMDGLTLNLGVRLDHQEIEFNGHTGWPTVIQDPNFTFDDVTLIIDEIEDTGVAPRLGFSWDVNNDGRNVIRGSASRFYSTIPGYVGTWDRGTYAVGLSCSTDPVTGECLSTETPEPLYYYWMDRDIKMPYTDEFTVGYEREVLPELAAGITLIWREGTDLLQDIEANIFYTDEDGDGIQETRNRRNNNFNRPMFVVGNHDSSEYWGVELTARKRLSDNWQLLFSWTISHAQGDGEWGGTAEGDEPRNEDVEYADLSYDQRHVVKLDGTYFLPLDFIVSASARYQTGTPYSITGKAFNDDNGNGIPDPGEVPPGAPTTFFGKRNSERNPSYFNLDLRAEKDFVFKGVTLGIFGDVFNVFNNHAVVDTTANIFPDGTGVPQITESKRFGRRFQLGFRINF